MRQTYSKLYAGAAVAVVLAGGLGFGLARMTGPKPAASSEKAEKPEGAEAKGGDTVPMDASRIQAAGIGVQTVSSGSLAAEILAPATVAAAPDGQAVLTARAAGAVTRIFKRLGDPVSAGETVALVESREAASIAADRSSAAAKATLAQKALQREQYLFEQKVSPRQDLEQAQAEAASAQAEARRAQSAAGAAHVAQDGRSLLVTSPITGRITSATTSLGAFVQPESELFRISDPRRSQIEAAVPAADALRLAPGDRAIIELQAGGAQVQATVRSVAPALNTETRSATVVLNAPADAALQPGQLLRVRLLPRGAAKPGIVVPEDALQTVGGRDSVFVRTDKGFTARPVTVGQRAAGRVEIVGGLAPGAQIAVKNAFLLKAELGKGAEEEE